MKKIKELESRIERLESLRNCANEVSANRYDIIRKRLDTIEIKQKEQEKFLQNTVAPFIANRIEEELDKYLDELADALANSKSSVEEPKKKAKKEPKCEKNKIGRPKQKKENK